MKILITGGLGFIGLNLIQSLESENEIVIFDKKSIGSVFEMYGSEKTKFLHSSHIKAVKGDICDEELLFSILNATKFDCIIHLCAISSVAEAESNKDECNRVNIYGSEVLLKTLSKSISKNAGIIFTSSREVYGDTKGQMVNENAVMHPINQYGKSKLKSQQIIEDYAKTNHNPCIIFQLSNVYGGYFDKPSRVIPNFSAKLIAGQEICIYGGEQILDFVYIGDVISCIKKALDVLSHTRICERFILSSAKGVRLKDLVLLLENEWQTKAKVDYKSRRNFEVENFIGDNTKAVKFFNMRFRDITQGLSLYVRLCQANRVVLKSTQKELVC